jgi:CBS domain containing-hemolysin-like protein
MTSTDVLLLVVAAALVLLAGLLASAGAAIDAMTRARATELAAEGRTGGRRLVDIVGDAPRYVNSALLAQVMCETTAVVIVARVTTYLMNTTGPAIVLAAAIMVVVSYIAVGVGPQTVGRQHSERVALVSAAPIAALSVFLAPVAQILILIGNAITPGRGFRDGPFSSEAELRELVDLAEQSQVIESGERKMIHSVFELGDTLVREVMVPRTDVVFIERYKTLRQMLSLALRSGFSRLPVVGEDLDDVIGVAYLKDVTKRVFDNRDSESTQRIETVMRPCMYVPDSKAADQLLHEMQAQRIHLAVVVDEYGGTAGLVTIEDILEEIVGEITDEYDVAPEEIERVNGGVRVSSRLPVDDLDELFGVAIDDEDVETVGGLMAKHLGRVPIPGTEVVVEGLRFRAESRAGRRNRVVAVLISPEGPPESEPADGDDRGAAVGNGERAPSDEPDEALGVTRGASSG